MTWTRQFNSCAKHPNVPTNSARLEQKIRKEETRKRLMDTGASIDVRRCLEPHQPSTSGQIYANFRPFRKW